MEQRITETVTMNQMVELVCYQVGILILNLLQRVSPLLEAANQQA